jgi:hypothetical protein
LDVIGAARVSAIVVRPAKIIFIALGAIAGCVVLSLVFAWNRRPSSVPVASIVLVGYTNIILSNPDTNVLVFPGRGKWVRATMTLKNRGPLSICYPAWANEPYGWATAQTPDGSTNGYLAPHFTGGIAVLPAGSNAMFWVYLPPDTLSWECGFSVETASVRERAISKLFQTRVWAPLQPLCGWALRLLPDKTGPELEVTSRKLKIAESADTAHNQSLHSRP